VFTVFSVFLPGVAIGAMVETGHFSCGLKAGALGSVYGILTMLGGGLLVALLMPYPTRNMGELLGYLGAAVAIGGLIASPVVGLISLGVGRIRRNERDI
jgi:hypothetical protein